MTPRAAEVPESAVSTSDTPAFDTPASAFEVTERVRWEDVDLVGIVRYSAYTRLLDVAESELFRAVGLAHPTVPERYSVWLVRRALHLEYHASARFDALLRLRMWVGRVGRTSITLHLAVYDDAGTRLHAQGHVVIVAVPLDGMRPIPLPPEVVERLGQYRAE